MVRQYDVQRISDNLLKEYSLPVDYFNAQTDGTSKVLKSLYDIGWRTNFAKSIKYLACCEHQTKRIIFSLQFLEASSEIEIINTTKHEIAHALVGPYHAHDEVWQKKAIELGIEPKVCGNISVDSSRSISVVEQREKIKIGQLQKICPKCGEIAIETSHINLPTGKWIKLKCGHLVKKENLAGSEYGEWQNLAKTKQIFPYQVEGIEFIAKNNGRVLIADEPALGKTLQADGFLKYHADIACPALIVCKSTLKIQHVKELIEWCGPEFMPQVINTSKDFILPGLKVYIISMDLLRRMTPEKMSALGIKTVIADEIQHFKNADSTRTAELRRLVNSAEFFIALSGTPWKNRGSEYFPVLNMIDPVLFPSKQKFVNDWIEYYYDPKSGKMKEGGIRNIQEFRKVTSHMIIRRMRDDVQKDLPTINRVIRFVELDKYEDIYNKEESRVAAAIKDSILDGTNMANIASEIMRLKHITGLAKAAVCVEDAIQFLEDADESEKLAIFYHHVDVGLLLSNGDPTDRNFEGLNKYLLANGYNACLRIDGSSNNRQDIVDKWKMDPKNRVVLLSSLAAGEGLNLQFCRTPYMLERQWNPANEEQCELRFSRHITLSDLPEYLQPLFHDQVVNKTKTKINVPYFIAADTIDEMLTDIVEHKRVNYNKSMNVGQEDLKFEENDIIRELGEMIVRKRYAKK